VGKDNIGIVPHDIDLEILKKKNWKSQGIFGEDSSGNPDRKGSIYRC